MKIRKIGFVGCGRIARILLQGLMKADPSPEKVFATDSNKEAAQSIKALFPGMVASGEAMSGFEQADLIFLAVHTHVLMNVLPAIKLVLQPGTVVCSLAPKITIDKIALALGRHDLVVRMNPNAPSIVNAGFNPVSFSPSYPDRLKANFIDFISTLGECPVVEEKKLEAFAVISAMGPTYLWFQLFELVDLARRFGLDGEEAQAAVSSLAVGTGLTMSTSGLSPADIQDLVSVKPLGENEEEIRKIYQAKLMAMYLKLTS
jgi:pyrroline-5-carboxylate reductase